MLREEIREGLKEYLRPNLKYEEESLVDGVVIMVLETLSLLGVVIKEDGELPEEVALYDIEVTDMMLKAGYTKTSPLIGKVDAQS